MKEGEWEIIGPLTLVTVPNKLPRWTSIVQLFSKGSCLILSLFSARKSILVLSGTVSLSFAAVSLSAPVPVSKGNRVGLCETVLS